MVRSILMMSLSNIKKKKVQNLFIAIIIMVSALIFSTSLGILGGINKPFETMHEKLSASHLGLFFDSKMHDPTEMSQWWESQEGVSSVSSTMTSVLVETPIHQGKKVDIQFYISEVPPSVTRHDKLLIVEGDKKEFPGTNEIWIPTALAYAQKIKLDDTLTIPLTNGKKDLKVTAIVVDPIFSTSMINPTRAWIAPGALSVYYPATQLNNVFLGIRYTDLSKEKQLWTNFEEHLGKPFTGIKFTYSLLSMAFLMLYQMIGITLLLFAFILLFVALYILFSTITDAIISDYRTIGILKSEGFTPGNVISVYVMQMGILSIMAIPLGIALSTFAIKMVLGSLLKSLGIANLNMPLLLPFTLSFILLLGLILLFSFIAARKAGKVKPANAIKFGAPPEDALTQKNSRFILIKRVPVIVYLGLNQLLSSKKQIAFSFITFCVTAFVIITGINTYHSLNKMADNRSFIGFDDSDVTLTSGGKRFRVESKDLLEKIKSDNRVENVIMSGYITTAVVPATGKEAALNIIGINYDGNMDVLGLKNIEGKNPVKENEIALATNTAKTYNKKVGDTFDMFLEGTLFKFKVTGIYQSVNNLGQGYRIQTSAIKAANPLYENNQFLVKLKDNTNLEEYMHDMKKKYGEAIDAQNTTELYSKFMKPIVSNMGMAIIFISVIFILVLSITIFSSSLLSIHRQKKNFGIFKTMGLTPLQVRLSIVIRYVFIGTVATILGSIAGIFLTPKLLTMMCSVFGMVNFPTSINILQTVLIIPCSLLLGIVCSWIPSGQILKINPRNLVSE